VLAVSLFAEDPRHLRDRLRLLAGQVQWVELRLDRAPPGLDLAALRAEFPELRFLAAFRPLAPAARAERGEWLRNAASAGCDALDLPLGEEVPLWAARVPLVRSFHESEGAPSDLAARLREGLSAARAGDLVKIVAWADTAESAARVFPLYEMAPAGSLLAFAMGPGGAATRLWAPAFGAPFTFACWPGEETALGQMDWRTLTALLPARPDARAPLYGVIGRPVSHSLSPRLWSASFRLERPPAASVYAPCAAGDLAAFLRAHSGERFAAFSVTAPFKEAALRAAAQADPLAVACGAANFLLRERGGWRACNTDGAAALDASEAAGLRAPGPLLILGAGGAARAAAAEALRRGYAVTVAARRPETARALVEDLRALGTARACGIGEMELADAAGVIQATTLGSRGQPGNPAAGRELRAGAVVLDMVYDPPRTEFLLQAQRQGAIAVAGVEMLVRQMIEQVRLARGSTPPLELLRDDLRRALRARASDPRRALALIGPRASGKSALGVVVARKLRRRFTDADVELARHANRPLAAWLSEDPHGFRAAEAALLPELLAESDAVVALGGGIVESAEARACLGEHAAVIWLHASVEEQSRRRQGDRTRPALTDLPLAQELIQVQARRLPWYRACARLCVVTDGDSEDATARLLAAAAEIGLTPASLDR
jgi:shikimate dehydrogenase